MNKKLQLVVNQDDATAKKGKASVLLAQATELLEAGDFWGAAAASWDAANLLGNIAQENTSEGEWLERMADVKPDTSKLDPERHRIMASLKSHQEGGSAAPAQQRAHVARLLSESAVAVRNGGFDFETFPLTRTLAIATCYRTIARSVFGGVAERDARYIDFLQQAIDDLEAGNEHYLEGFINASMGFSEFMRLAFDRVESN